MTDPRAAPLRALLLAHEPADGEEARHRDAMLTQCVEVHEPFSRATFSPGHFTASAFVLSPDEACMALIFHGKLHRWLQPGGHVEPTDEDIVAAARREVAEELGLTGCELVGSGLFDVDVHTIPARKADPAHLHLDVRVLLRAPQLELAPGDDAQDARWVPLDRVHTLESDASVLRAVGRLARR